MLESSFAYIETLILSDLPLVSAFAVWFVTFIAGENGGLFSIFLSFQGYLPVTIAVVFTFLGSFSADLFWYFTTTLAIGPMLDRRRKKKAKDDPDRRSFFVLADKYPYTILIFIKFMVGVRLILTVYIVAKHKIPFFKYFLCNLIANLLFVGGLLLLVWSIRESLDTLFDIDRSITTFITVIFVVMVLGNLALRAFQYGLLKSFKHINKREGSSR